MSATLSDTAPLDASAQAADGAPPESMARATGVIALGNIASRVLGLARETMLSTLFGAGAAVDAFNLAIIVPRSLYDLLIGGHVNSALVPVLSEYAAEEGDRRDLWALVSAPNGNIYRVGVGNYLGKNYGHIIKINKESIEMLETVSDGQAGWVQQPINLDLATKDK